MAKKRRGRPKGSTNKPRIESAAEAVGGTLGSLMARVDSWMQQRDQLVADLRSMADNLASGGKAVVGSAMKVASVVPAAAAKARKRAVMSPEARARIAEAQRKRWAKQKAAAKKAKKGGTSSNG